MNDRRSPRVVAAQKYLPRAVALLAVLGMFSWLFGAALFSDRSFVYRDAAHYYDPLFEFTADEWAAGRIPLWNPYDGIGAPLLADTTSSVLYPGKVIFALPLAFATKYKLYICSHVLLAAGTAYLLARRWRASLMSAAVCGISYAFCGNVVFQYCNVVFLVGAAWMPLAVYCADKMLVTRRIAWAPALGCVLALMTFGGDPQAAYHAGLMAAGYAFILWRRDRKRKRGALASTGTGVPGVAPRGTSGEPPACDVSGGSLRSTPATRPPPSPSPWNLLVSHRLVLLVAAAVCGGVLAAAQILPAMEWSHKSQRAAYDAPRSLYEIPGKIARENGEASDRAVTESLFAKSRTGEHLEHVYFFSFGPWRLVEYVWPNISGRQFPTHRRWMEAIPAEGLAWTPSCYMGLLPLLCAVISLRFWRGPVRQRWISWTVLLAILGSFGWYGLGWLVYEVWHGCGGDPANLPFGPGVGGVYWLMTVVLPGYVYFRFPGKLLIVAALGLSLLAARGWDRAFAGSSPKLRRTFISLAALSLTGAVVLWLVRSYWAGWFQGVAPNILFGPLDADGAWHDVTGGFLHTAILCGLLFCLLPRGPRIATSGPTRFAVRPALALILTATEIAIANHWLVPTAPREHWHATEPLIAAIHDADKDPTESTVIRVDRAEPRHWFAAAWRSSGSSQRLSEALVSDNATLMPRFHLRHRLGVTDAVGTIASQDYVTFMVEARWSGRPRAGRGRFLHPHVQNALATDYAILRGNDSPPSGWSRVAEFYPTPANEEPAEEGNNAVRHTPEPFAVLWQNPQPQPRVWIAKQVRTVTGLESNTPALVRSKTREVLSSGGRFRNLRTRAIIETSSLSEGEVRGLNDRVRWAPVERSLESCRIVVDQPQRVVVETELRTAGVVVVSDLYDPGWEARVTSTTNESLQENSRLEVLRTNRVMRGVVVPNGRHRIEFRYRPKPFYLGAVISAAGWIALTVATLLTWLRRAVTHYRVFTRRVA